MHKQITIVAAVGRSGQIGLEGRIPWRVPGDMKHFRELTAGGTVLVGRKTFESMGKLKGRNVIVVSRSMVPGADMVVSSCVLPDAAVYGKRGLFVCGGAGVYRTYLKHADRMVLSRVDYDGPADTYFPSAEEIKAEGWRLCADPRAEEGFVVEEYHRPCKGAGSHTKM